MDAFITASFSYPPPAPKHPRLYLLHDFQCTDVEPPYKPRIWDKKFGTPETEKSPITNAEQMNEAWQWLAFDFFSRNGKMYTLADLKRKWADFMHGAKFLTNNYGSDTNADYINGTNLDKEPMRKETITCGGNVMAATGNKRIISGVPSTGVWMLDMTQAPPTFDELRNHPYANCFVHVATVCRPERGTRENFPRHAPAPNGTYIVNHFPHFDGAPVPFLFASMKGDQAVFEGLKVREGWMRDTRVCQLDDDESPSPVVA